MNTHTSHDRLWQKRLDALSAVWPDFLGGETKALHKARVASRRIREALPVVAASAPAGKVRKLKKRMRELTQFLGPIRELDVELDLLDKQIVDVEDRKIVRVNDIQLAPVEGRLRLVALIEQASVVQRILRHLGLPTEVPEPRPARAPPRRLETLEDQSRDAPEFDAAW